MPDFALELSFDDRSDSVIRAQWDALKAAGLPSQADHRSMTNAPHLTLIAAAGIPAGAIEHARTALNEMLPLELPSAGLVVFGVGARRTIAHLIEPEARLHDVVIDLRGRIGSVRHPMWTPHVTLARRMPRAEVGRAVDLLGDLPMQAVIATRLRFWDPEAGHITELVGPSAESP